VNPIPAVHLDVQAGVADRGRDGQGRRDRRGVTELITAANPGPARIPPGGRRHLGRHQHVRAMVLDRLERRDRPAELLADLRVLGRLLGRLAGDADRLGREHRPGHGGQQPARARQHRRWCPLEADPGRRPARVQVGGHLRLNAAGRLLDHQHVLTCRDQQHVRQVTADHDAGLPGRRTVSEPYLAAERGRADHAAVSQPRQQPLAQVGWPGSSQHSTGHHGRDERPRCQVAAHLFGHDQRLEQPEARAAVLFR
jgi:hypothetical protein